MCDRQSYIGATEDLDSGAVEGRYADGDIADKFIRDQSSTLSAIGALSNRQSKVSEFGGVGDYRSGKG